MPETEELPEEEPQVEEEPEEDRSIPVDPSLVIGDDQVVIDNNGNAIFLGNQSQLQNNFASMLMDVNMCAIEIIYKYNLTEPVK